MDRLTKTDKFPKIVDVTAMLLIFFVSQGIVGLLLLAFGFTQPTTSLGDFMDIETYMSLQEELGKYNAITYLLMMAPSIALMWLYARLRGGRGVVRIRCSAAGLDPTIILVGVLWLLSAQIVLEPLLLLLPPAPPTNIGLGLWAIITAIITAPVLEELLCRGLLLETLRKRCGLFVSILIPSLFFGVIHGDLSTMIVATVAGFIFGVLYVRTSSIFTTIIVHSINNAMAFSLVNFEKDTTPLKEMVGTDTNYYILYGIAAAIFVLASVESYFRVFRCKSKSEKPIVGVEAKAEVDTAVDVENEPERVVEAETEVQEVQEKDTDSIN